MCLQKSQTIILIASIHFSQSQSYSFVLGKFSSPFLSLRGPLTTLSKKKEKNKQQLVPGFMYLPNKNLYSVQFCCTRHLYQGRTGQFYESEEHFMTLNFR